MAGVMLVALVLRVLIPPGFMPASGRPFAIEICWDGLPAGLLAHVDSLHADSMGMDAMPMERQHLHHGSRSQSEHCVFGAACSAGPIPYRPLQSDISSAKPLRAVALAPIARAIRVVHLPQPRAPPRRLS